ncbi:unnamed protein product [Bemisia tabaci]|uniref:Uncharacterized protein n=1 Tax=Bemisia tabaci TaxID=7038 RepID=A0A9P0A8U1_BEMTA|nr:unnamed protein product [Bemisia tabaci]
MDRIANSFANSYKIFILVVVGLSLFLKFVPYFITVTVLVILFGILVYFDASCATDVCAQIVSWVHLLYAQISNCFVNINAQPRKVTHHGPVNFRPPFQINHLNYMKMKNDMPSPIPRELNLNPSVRPLRNRSVGPSPVPLDYCINFRDDKSAGSSHCSPRSGQNPKSPILNDITPNYSTHQRYSPPSRSDRSTRRDYHVPSPGPSSISSNCSQLYDNISSPGFSGRIAQCVSEQNSLNRSKLQNLGDFPLVHFNQQEAKKKLSPNNSQTTSKPRVTVRIAPPANRSLKKVYNVEQEEKMKSVLEVLKEMSRKRMYSSVDTDEAENCKRLRTTSQSDTPINRRVPISPNSIMSLDITPLGKRIRDTSSDSIDEEVKKKRKQVSTTNNEIKSSLSSSLAITPPHLSRSNSNKRKATNDITSADKHFKASSISDQSSETSSEKSSLSSHSVNAEAENNNDSIVEEVSSENTEIEARREISLDKTSGSSVIIKKTRKSSEDSVDSNSSLSHDETGVLRLKPIQRKIPVLKTPEEKPNKDILRLPKDWEANPRSLQKTPKNPGKMLKKILCAIEGTEDINFDSMPEHVKKLIAHVDDVDSSNSPVSKSTADSTKEIRSEQKQSPLSSNAGINKASTSVTTSFASPVVSSSLSSFKFPDSGAKTGSPFTFSASSQLSNPLLSGQR